MCGPRLDVASLARFFMHLILLIYMSPLAHLEMLFLDIEYWTDVWKSSLRIYGEDCLEQFGAAGGENG